MESLDGLPGLAPPPGVVPNFVNPYSAAPPAGAAIGVLSALATIGFSLRMFTKLYIMRQFAVEDCM